MAKGEARNFIQREISASFFQTSRKSECQADEALVFLAPKTGASAPGTSNHPLRLELTVLFKVYCIVTERIGFLILVENIILPIKKFVISSVKVRVRLFFADFTDYLNSCKTQVEP